MERILTIRSQLVSVDPLFYKIQRQQRRSSQKKNIWNASWAGLDHVAIRTNSTVVRNSYSSVSIDPFLSLSIFICIPNQPFTYLRTLSPSMAIAAEQEKVKTKLMI